MKPAREADLMQHQRIHQNKLERTPFGGLGVFDDVGTGKTISALNVLSKHLEREGAPALILVPPALMEKWEMECKKWCDIHVNTARVDQNRLILEDGVNIMSHGQCHRTVLREIPKIGLIIIDEVHHFRNQEAKSSKFVLQLCKCSEKRLVLTATPIQNSQEDMVSIVHLIIPFVSRDVCRTIVAHAMGVGDHSLLRPIMTRCTPTTSEANRVVNDHHVKMSENEEGFVYGLFRSDGKVSHGRLSDIMMMKIASSSLSTLKSFTGHEIDLPDSKVQYTSSLVEGMCNQGKKAIVFSEFINTAREISAILDSNLIGTITGETPAEIRSAFLTGLKHSRSGAIVMTDVGGEGLDMQFVDCIVNHDLPWNPMILEQRIGRLDRIGRDDRDVEIHNILLEDSLDSHIVSILKNKEIVARKFGGYGRMIEPDEALSSIRTTMKFSSISSQVYEADLEELESGDFGLLQEQNNSLQSFIDELT